MHKNIILSQVSMANANILSYFAFRDEEDGFQVSQVPPPPTARKKKVEDVISKVDHITRREHIQEIWE
jgi:hypothetical protein